MINWSEQKFNILWLVNVPLPEASLLMNEKPTPFGGWLVNASKDLSEKNEIELSIAFPKNGLICTKMMQGENMKFFAFPPINEKALTLKSNVLQEIVDKVKPDLVHIFGTEYAHTLAMVNTCRTNNINTVISIQGLVSIYAKHYMASLPSKVQKSYTFRDFIKQDNLEQQRKNFIKRGKWEIEALNKVDHIIGRTTWDQACTMQINSKAEYHFCNETLRDTFYNSSLWDINRCENNSIFVSQGGYPIKGLHFMLEALPLILKRFPNTKLYIGGNDITKSDTLKQKLSLSSYGKYIKALINKNNLQEKVIFTGVLDETQMYNRLLKSHVFVCPSSIENSPNSLGEAMILGVPSVASDVGGVADMIKHIQEGFVYQSDAPYMLAHYIMEIFSNDNLTLELSRNAKQHALKTHDKTTNTITLLKIYSEIISGKVEVIES